ncbi:hypothetical protein [Microbacterium sp. A93]|uniref:hypothetical protein n=1 Tax=Microbacterium sp. A93 TaxID=3450716 RepID=UPI003F432246
MSTPSQHVPPAPSTSPAIAPLSARSPGWSDAPKRKWWKLIAAQSGQVADLYRAGLWTVVALLAITIWFVATPSSTGEDRASDISSAEAVKTINDNNTEGAPQQQVVNGWFVADTIPILSEQLSDVHEAINTGRLPSLAFLFGLGACADLAGRSLLSFVGRKDQSDRTSDVNQTPPNQVVPTLEP